MTIPQTIPVDPEIALAYYNASPQHQQTLQHIIRLYLDSIALTQPLYLSPFPLPPHPLQNLTTQAYQQKIDATFQSFQNIHHDPELPIIFTTIDQERHEDLGRHFPEWES